MDWIVFAITIGVVAFFALGLSLTLIFKGHNIQSEISENPAMRERGIACALQDDHHKDGDKGCDGINPCPGESCATCTLPQKDETKFANKGDE